MGGGHGMGMGYVPSAWYDAGTLWTWAWTQAWHGRMHVYLIEMYGAPGGSLVDGSFPFFGGVECVGIECTPGSCGGFVCGVVEVHAEGVRSLGGLP